MPEVKLHHVISCSSEDKKYPADNLLKRDSFSKWKCVPNGEKQASVVIQLEKATTIHQVDIGNEGSAFIEVLVSKSSSNSDDYQVLLVTSSFMTPIDSRNGQNGCRVRIFDKESLSNAALDQKWDRVKVVCTQPFNKTASYGLSFIKLHSSSLDGASGDQSASTSKTQNALGGFRLKADTPDVIQPGSLFASRAKEKATPAPLTGAAAVRAASKVAEVAQNAKRDERETTQRKASVEGDKAVRDPVAPSPAPGPSTSRDRERTSSTPLRKQSTSVSSVASGESSSKRSRNGTPPLKKMRSEPTKQSREVAFNKLMKKVVFVLSGFKNPQRGQLRDKAIEMGAQYKPDWGKGCTHLICAFENTPKYTQVKGQGRIVSHHWITDSHKRKKKLPWRQYRQGKAATPPGSSESDSEEEIATHVVDARSAATAGRAPKRTAAAAEDSGEDTDLYGGSTDSEGDTEDEIRRVTEAAGKSKKPKSPPVEAKTVKTADPVPKDDDDPAYSMSTDEDGASVGDNKEDIPELPDFFTGKHFLLYGTFTASERRSLRRYIVAFNGTLDEYMGEKVNYVVTKDDWDDTFDEALSENPDLIFVRPEWIAACDDAQKRVPCQKFQVVPSK